MSAGVVRPRWHRAIDVLVSAMLCTLALVPLQTAFDDVRYWLAVGGAVVVGAGVAVLAARLGWGALPTAGLAAVGYVGFGGVFALRETTIAGLLPSLETLRELAAGVVQGWKQLLTVTTPVSGFEQLFGVPYLAGLVATVLTVSFALRLRHHWLALLPVAALLVFSISFGDATAVAPTVVGASLAVLGLGWIAWRRVHARTAGAGPDLVVDSAERARARTRRVAFGAAVLLAAGTVGGGSLAAFGDGLDRTLLREQVVPPLELRSFASPLMSFRKLVEDGEESTLFTVSGLPADGVIRLASLDLYDGIVYKVSGAGGDGSGVFSRVGRVISGQSTGEAATIGVRIKDLKGVWVPDTGHVTRFEFTGGRAEDLASGLHYNQATGTAVATAGLTEGDAYTFQAQIPRAPTTEQLAHAQIAPIRTPMPQMMPDMVQTLVDEAITGAEAPIDQVLAIRTYLYSRGTLSHGLESDKVKSRPGHTYERISSMLAVQQLVGDDEQYAVLMALMLAQVGLPSRVVMGFAPEQAGGGGEVAVTGADVKAWVEVPLVDYGWVAFYPTPVKEPEPQTPQSRQKPKAQVPQPPLPPQEPALLPPDPPAAEPGEETFGPDYAWLWAVARIGGVVLAGLGVAFGPGLVMLWLKARRRQRRRTASNLPDRFSGGWAEIVDTAADAGVATSAVATRREYAADLGLQYPELGLARLAARADVAVFGAGEPDQADVAAYWADVDTARKGITRQSSGRQRLRQFFWPVSVLGSSRRRRRR